MAITPILPNPVRDAALRYTPGVLVSDARRALYVSGQVAVDADGRVPEGIEAQARQVWRNLEAVLTAAHMSLGDIVKITTFLIDREDFAASSRVRGEVLGGHKPASTLVYVSGLVQPEWRLEIEAIAVAAV